jgi:hypothetical protein
MGPCSVCTTYAVTPEGKREDRKKEKKKIRERKKIWGNLGWVSSISRSNFPTR